jgi:N-acyl-D-aspartate/D-glutamate deacylase
MRRLFAPALAIAALAACAAWQPALDVLVRNGLVYDGFGQEPRHADIGIVGDRITAIGSLGGAHAALHIDAAGLVVAPGFIDAHSRAVLSVMADGVAENLVHQGVTSLVLSDDEGAVFGTTGDRRDELRPFGPVEAWSSIDGYFQRLLQRGVVPNVGALVPAFPPGGLAAVEAALARGALGVLLSREDLATTTGDLDAVARLVARYDVVLAVHPRGDLPAVVATVDAMLALAQQTLARVLLLQPELDEWSMAAVDTLVAQVRTARASGVAVFTSATPSLSHGAETARWLVQSGGVVGSQAASHRPRGPQSRGPVPPSTYDAFTHVLGVYVREQRALSLGEAIRRMTGDPATHFHLDGRGAVREGYVADLTIFDASSVQGHATAERPHQIATGVQYVIVAGVPVLDSRGLTGARPGRALSGRARANTTTP